MKTQHKVILSIGSNQGNKLDYLDQCVNFIHHEIGSVIKISKVYQTPSWGFESDDFFNACLFIHTFQSPQKIWRKIESIEKKMGRIRSEQLGYEPRNIDIDIISFNDEIIETQDLQIPHPQMQNRLFVLLPIMEIKSDFFHPIINKSISELIADCSDKSVCKPIGNLRFENAKYAFNTFNYIAIEGNIGAGKTTLTNKIAEDFNAKTVLERFADNPFLPKFYEDQNRYAFPLEMSFLADRYQQISDDLAQFDLFKDFIVADYHIFKSLIFAKVTLAEDEYRLYRNLFDIIYREMPKPDLYVYLYQNTEKLLANIKQRGRSYEQEIPAEYLEKINSGYLEYIKSQADLNVLIIDVTNRDFVENQEDYIFVLDEIKNKTL